ncbi:MAG: hypothetical protein JWO03_1399 [Bacteroidetes bacterium]|nr:hypothetical protein [Bacteroidota bacterium]
MRKIIKGKWLLLIIRFDNSLKVVKSALFKIKSDADKASSDV